MSSLFPEDAVIREPRPPSKQHGLHWDGRRKLVLRAGTTATSTMLTMVPAPIRHAPLTYFNWAA